MSYTYVVSESGITLINISNGNKVTIFESDPRYTQFKCHILDGDYELAEKLDVKVTIENFTKGFVKPGTSFNVTVEDGVGSVQLNGASYPLEDSITNRIIKMEQEGFSAQPLVNFLSNLYDNPSKTAIDELFLFLTQTDLPITVDGHIIAYKIVRKDFMDIYSGKFDNSVGKVCEMPRFEVDDKRSNTCSSGLHFCSKDYLVHYGSSKKDTDNCVLVKINPKDVVSIPNDYNNAKGRTCRYEVVGVMDSTQWREILSERDYNESSVVDEMGEDYDEDYNDTRIEAYNEDYLFDTEKRRWVHTSSSTVVSRDKVMFEEGMSLEEIIDLEVLAMSNK